MRLRGFDNIGHTFRLPEAHVMAESAAAVAAAWQTYRGRTVTGAVMTFAGQFGDGRARSLGSDAGRATRAEDVARRSQGTASSARGRSQGTRDCGTRRSQGTRDSGGDGNTRRPVRARISIRVCKFARARCGARAKLWANPTPIERRWRP